MSPDNTASFTCCGKPERIIYKLVLSALLLIDFIVVEYQEFQNNLLLTIRDTMITRKIYRVITMHQINTQASTY